MERKLKFQREADPAWALRVSEWPGCEGLFSCLQCGSCSGTCPLSIYMDFAPRRIIALVREGFREEALSSQTIWLCACCYSCAVHCPRGSQITDVMYGLKQEAIRYSYTLATCRSPCSRRSFIAWCGGAGATPKFASCCAWRCGLTLSYSLACSERVAIASHRSARFAERADQRRA